MKLALPFLGVLLFTITTRAQVAGNGSLHFVNAPLSARMAGLGGVNVSLADRDINFFFSNPALAGDTLERVASASYQRYVADISQAGAAYAHRFGKVGLLTMGVQHFDYGTITAFDETGMETGKFKSAETALVVGRSHTIGNYRIGVNLKGLFSNFAGNRADAVGLDLGGVFIHPTRDFTAGLTFRNIGFVFSDYSSTAGSALPFDVQVGTTFKPQHMPFRFSLTAYQLTNTRMSRDDPADESDDPSLLDEVLGHVNFGTEILFHRNVNVLVGYNFNNHRSLRLPEGGAGAGVTAGLVFKVRGFEFVASRSGYVAGSATYAFTLSKSLQSFKRI